MFEGFRWRLRAGRHLYKLVFTMGPRLIASASVASIVALTPYLWAPAEIFASVLSTHFEGAIDGMHSDVKRMLREVAIVKIDRAHFQTAYGAQSPLDRCVVADDLGRLFSLPDLKVVALDFYLSPYRIPQGSDRACQERLDRLLDEFASSRTLILMQPVERDPDTVELSSIAKTWADNRKTHGARFAHVEFEKPFGMIARYTQPSIDSVPALGLAFRQALMANAHMDDAEDFHAPRQIAIRSTEALFSMGNGIPIHKLCTPEIEGRSVCSHITGAIVGSGYSADDMHPTVGGYRDGVDLHGAIAVCPRAGATHLQHFLLDIVLGLFSGWIFKAHWNRYYDTASGERARCHAQLPGAPQGIMRRAYWWATPHRTEAAYGWLVWMAFFGFVLIFMVGWLSLLIFGGACATGIFPVGIVVGMFIEAAIIQGPETAAHKMHAASKDAASKNHDAAPHPSSNRIFQFENKHTAFKTLVAVVFILCTVKFSILSH